MSAWPKRRGARCVIGASRFCARIRKPIQCADRDHGAGRRQRRSAARDAILENYDVSLGAGLGKVAGKVFRIGHLGWMNESDGDRRHRRRRARPRPRRREAQEPAAFRPRSNISAAILPAMDVERLAEKLIATRRSLDRLAALAPDEIPASAAEAYAVQDAILHRLAIPIAGWKAGASSPTAEPQAGTDPRRSFAAKPGTLRDAGKCLPHRRRRGRIHARARSADALAGL